MADRGRPHVARRRGVADQPARRDAPRPHARRAARARVLVRRLAPHQRVVHVDARALKRWGLRGLIALGCGAGVWALLLLAHSVENTADFNRRQPWILRSEERRV